MDVPTTLANTTDDATTSGAGNAELVATELGDRTTLVNTDGDGNTDGITPYPPVPYPPIPYPATGVAIVAG